ncbi:MAG TPA: DUF1003 domain-containing protein [Anaerolineales bacterium]
MQDSRHPQNESGEQTNPTVNKAIERYIRTIVHMRLKAARERTPEQRLADAITSFSGRMAFVYIHIVWFSAWILLNSGLLNIEPFDPFPSGLLTMIVYLEAIFSLHSFLSAKTAWVNCQSSAPTWIYISTC